MSAKIIAKRSDTDVVYVNHKCNGITHYSTFKK